MISDKRKWLQRSILILLLIFIHFVSNQFFDWLETKNYGEHKIQFHLPLSDEIAAREKISIYPTIEKIVVSGFFSDWDTQSEVHRLVLIKPNLWQHTLYFAPGENQYKFAVYIKGREQPVWLEDSKNPLKVQDSYGNYNSVVDIPDISAYRFMFNLSLIGSFLFLLLYYFVEPILRWIMRLPIPLRLKLSLNLIFVVIFSNLLFISYHFYETRQTIKVGIVDSIHLAHLMLQADEIDFTILEREKHKLSKSINHFFWDAKTRVEKYSTSPLQITLSDFAVFDSQLKLLVLNHRQQNSELQQGRAIALGFTNREDYFVHGLLAPAIEMAKNPNYTRQVLFTNPTANASRFETNKTQFARYILGFSSFLHPIILRGELLGYYGGNIQVKMYGEQLVRIVYFNLALLSLICLLAFMLIYKTGRIFTFYLSELAEWSKNVLKGNFDYPVNIDSRDEIQTLSENFSTMGKTLKQSFAEVAKKNHQLQIEAYVDGLTGLSNRKKMYADLQEHPAKHFLLFNINSFKSLNDYFGYEFGDQVLIETAERLSRIAKNNTILYRVGSDEFGICILNEMSFEMIEEQVNALCDLVENTPYQIINNDIYISITVGIAHESKEIDGRRALQTRAEIALKEAKSSLIRFAIFREDMDIPQLYENNMSWVQRLRMGIDQDRIVPFFQPIICNSTKEIKKFECLVRMLESDGSVVLPGYFLEVSKNARIYSFITQIVLKKSFEAFKSSKFEFTINLSIEDILDKRTYQCIFTLLEENLEASSRLTFEIVETAEIKNYDVVRNFINEVKKYRCKIAIDDFGSGYSNFVHILSLNIDYIKIDGTLIRDVDTNLNNQMIVVTIAEFATKMGIETIAEFVHSKAVYDTTRECGITFSQGFYLGKPVAKIPDNC